MNSIDDEAGAMLAALFDEVLMPIAQRMQAEGAEVFPLAPDVSWLSYYTRRKRSAMAPADFNSASCADVAEFEQRLRAYWESLGRSELAAQAGQFATAARAARSAQAALPAPDNVSPYVYAMF